MTGSEIAERIVALQRRQSDILGRLALIAKEVPMTAGEAVKNGLSMRQFGATARIKRACVDCGGEISPRRARILPNTRHCVKCAEKLPELLYRMVGQSIQLVPSNARVRV
jgi:RNA polymerase-binding transcription factor DksA